MVILPTFPPGASLTKGHSFTGSEGHSGKVGPEGRPRQSDRENSPHLGDK